MRMSKQEKNALVPALRFPAFRDAGEWVRKPFEEAFKRLTAKNSEDNQNALTISAQLGLVSQLDFFNKKVAAKDLSGYYLLHKGDFAYNKSYSQGYPMGAIKPLKLYDKGVVSTLYICFRAKEGFNASFFEHYFETGLLNPEIGKIAQEGGRAHGLLNVSVSEFFQEVYLVVPQPEEQQKIADCLTSIDELITAQTQKLDALKAHKKGLMQQLFPAEGETVPKLRFPEFQEPWVEQQLDSLCVSISSGRDQLDPDGEFDLYGSTSIIGKTRNPSFSGERILVARVGANAGLLTKTRGSFGVTDNALVVNPKPSINIDYLFHYLGSVNINKLIFGSGQPLITGSMLKSLPIPMPSDTEQEKISACFSSLDETITYQSRNLEAIQDHKNGLMQQLFPSLEEAEA